MIKQLAHINLFTNKREDMLKFYTEALGLKIKFTLDDKNGKPFGWYVECGEMTFIEIFDQAGAVKQWGGEKAALKHGSHYRHLCFEVIDLESYTSELTKKGVEVTSITVGMDNSKQAWVKDPDGNSIELMEYTKTSFQIVNR